MRNRRFNQQGLVPERGQRFNDWASGIDVSTQPTGERVSENWPLADRTMRQRVLRAKSPIMGQRIRSRRLNRQQMRSRRLR